ncbi:hypothetical protein PGTUg99_024731 [Puccinia graminis f. sp. tritici]|uniref:Uncharacterized protein n=1 Tax=Puccinia graminis f. sp. tritici TaxID=56615 RepID=A0A5B0RYB5_PUCGR|nr:hypothetical protein PGTUg99_024731 [Puccinia graminis f. sp. tritici]
MTDFPANIREIRLHRGYCPTSTLLFDRKDCDPNRKHAKHSHYVPGILPPTSSRTSPGTLRTWLTRSLGVMRANVGRDEATICDNLSRVMAMDDSYRDNNPPESPIKPVHLWQETPFWCNWRLKEWTRIQI